MRLLSPCESVRVNSIRHHWHRRLKVLRGELHKDILQEDPVSSLAQGVLIFIDTRDIRQMSKACN